MNAFAGNGDGGKTVAFGTPIQYLIPPDRRGRIRVTSLSYLDAGTLHTLSLMRPLGRTKCSAVGAAGQPVINLVADPGSAAIIYGGTANVIAANDFVAIRETDGITRVYKVSSVATLAITLTTNLAVGVNTASDVWFFGVPGDTDQRTGNIHPAFRSGTGSAVVTFTDREAGIVATIAADEPILFNSTNATATGVLTQISWCYTTN